jgi:hypothetical protein
MLISVVRYSDGSLPKGESVNTFGASMGKLSILGPDVDVWAQQTKPMTLDKQEVLRTAKKLYHPQ